MRKWRGSARLIAWMLIATLVGCGDREEEQQTLREALARLPQDTSSPEPELGEEETESADTSTFDLPGSLALPESAGILDLPAGDPVEQDTAPPRLTPGPPQDTEPWIPEPDTNPVLSDEWTAGLVEKAGDGSRMTTLESVRTARNDGFDRIVFEFESGRIPGYRVEYVDRPVRQCGSGQVVPLRGDGWLRIRFEPSQAHDDRGRPTVQDRARTADLPVLRELRLICDYEGQVEWVLGVASPNRFRVIELQSPARLVVDVRH